MKRSIFVVPFLFAAILVMHAYAASAQTASSFANPSAESLVAAGPQGWIPDMWGTTRAIFSYPSIGAQDGKRYLQVQITKQGSGDAKWYPESVAIVPGQTYTFSDWYESDIASGVDLQYQLTNGSYKYVHLADPALSATWKNYQATFKAPAQAKLLTVLHYIQHVGTLNTDNYSLVVGTTTGDGTGTSTMAQGTSISIANADTVPSQTIHAGMTRQPLGGFSTQVTSAYVNDAVVVPGLNFYLSTTSASAGLFTNIIITNENGVVMAGPIDGIYDASTGKQLLHFSETIGFPWGSHTYTISGMVPTAYPLGAHISISTNPSLNWSPAHSHNTNDPIPMPNASIQMNQMTAGN